MEEPAAGLILAGGRSRRFGIDKAAYRIDGRTMLEHVYDALSAVCPVVMLSYGARESPSGDSSPAAPAPPSATPYIGPAEDVDEVYPIILTTGRVVSQFLSGTQTRRIGPLVDHYPEPKIEIHPRLAEKAGIADGDWTTAESRRGTCTLRASVLRTIRPDTIFIPYHWAGRKSANQLTISAQDPIPRSRNTRCAPCVCARPTPHRNTPPDYNLTSKSVMSTTNTNQPSAELPEPAYREHRLAEAVRAACIEAALEGYEQARISGLCEEGALECAIDAIRMLDLEPIATSPREEPSPGETPVQADAPDTANGEPTSEREIDTESKPE